MSIPRILHISTATTWRGGEQQLAYLTEELADGRCDQHVICISESPMHAHCVNLGLSFSTVRKRSGIDLLLAKSIKTIAKTTNSMIVHSHDAHGHTAAVLANTIFQMGLPLVVSRRVDFHIHSSFSKQFKYKHSSIAKIICVSQAIAEIMASDLKSREKLCTVHSGIDISKFGAPTDGRLRRELGIGGDIKIVGNIAAHAPHKDLFTFIRTAKEVLKTRRDVHFVSIGDGPMSDEIKAFAAAEGLSDGLTFLGFRNDIAQLLPDFDVFLMTSETEGLGTTVLDAFAARVPVVSTNAGGIPEMVENGVTGLSANVKDHQALSMHVIRALDTDTSVLVNAATEKLGGFTKQSMASKTLEVYQEILR